MICWIFKVCDQKKYADVIGEEYIYDNTHSIKLSEGDRFLYLSTMKNRYEFIGFGNVADISKRDPVGREKRNTRVRAVYVAKLADVHWFAEPLDFSPQKGRINRTAVGVTNTLAWGISMPRITQELFAEIIQLAQPEEKGESTKSGFNPPKGVPTNEWIDPHETTSRYLDSQRTNIPDFEPSNFHDAREKSLKSLFVRRGQPKFRQALIEAYEGKCAVTGCDVLFALQAAHIYPYRGNDTSKVNNGLLLRSDIHDLFDLGLITFDTSSMTIILHETLKSSSYSSLNGKPLRLPAKEDLQPNRVYLNWHRAWWNNRLVRDKSTNT